jgi:hypothetical protein
VIRGPRREVIAARFGLGLAVVISCVALLGCAVQEVRTVEGLVITVEGDSPASVRSFTLRTPEGATLDFVIDEAIDFGHGGFPGAHLREHQALGEPVRVTYRSEGSGSAERRIVVRLEDAA